MSNEAWRAGWASRRRFITGAAAGAAWVGLGGFARAGGRKAFADDSAGLILLIK